MVVTLTDFKTRQVYRFEEDEEFAAIVTQDDQMAWVRKRIPYQCVLIRNGSRVRGTDPKVRLDDVNVWVLPLVYVMFTMHRRQTIGNLPAPKSFTYETFFATLSKHANVNARDVAAIFQRGEMLAPGDTFNPDHPVEVELARSADFVLLTVPDGYIPMRLDADLFGPVSVPHIKELLRTSDTPIFAERLAIDGVPIQGDVVYIAPGSIVSEAPRTMHATGGRERRQNRRSRSREPRHLRDRRW